MGSPDEHLIEFFRRFDSAGGMWMLALGVFLLGIRIRLFLLKEDGPKIDFLNGIIGLVFCVAGFLIMSEIRRRMWESGKASWLLAESWYFLPIKLAGFIGGIFVIKALTAESHVRMAWVFILAVTALLLSVEQVALLFGDMFYWVFQVSKGAKP